MMILKSKVRILQFCFDFFICKAYNIPTALISSSGELKIAQLLCIIIYRSFIVKNKLLAETLRPIQP